MKRILWIAIVCAGGVAGVGSARADGLPVLGVDAGPGGVASAKGDVRYATLPAGKNTVVARVDPRGGRILRSRLLHGIFTIPAVAYDGSAGGLSGDGRTLVLIRPRASFPRAVTPLLVVHTKRLLPGREILLRGDFSYDAVSPDGSLLYLIQYVSPTDPTRYAVRAYDLQAGRLLQSPVTDPDERAPMHGSPLTRVASPDGRWAYTLYDGMGKAPFVHALDTSTRSAHCIDLPSLAGTNLSQARLVLNSDTLTVASPRPVVAVDTRTFLVRAPDRPTAPERRAGFPWAVVLSLVGALTAVGALSLVLLRRRQRLAPVQ
jgi:hypothetical protein